MVLASLSPITMCDIMAFFPKAVTFSIRLAVLVFFTSTTTAKALSSPSLVVLEKISTISAAPTLLPAAPLTSSSPSLAPDITPLLPSTSGGNIAPSPSDGMMPTIPSNPSPPNPDEMAKMGPNSAVSPSGSFTAVAPTSAAASLSKYFSWNIQSSFVFFTVLLPLAIALMWC